MYQTKLSVIIVVYNLKRLLEQCLYSVRAAVAGLDTDIIVVDDSSGDGRVAHLQPLFPEVNFVENKEQIGYARSVMDAIHIAKGEYILLLSPAAVVGEESIRTLCFFMDEHPKAGAAGVRMLDAHGVFLPDSKRAFPTPWVSFCKRSGLSALFPTSRTFARYYLPYLSDKKEHKVDVLSRDFMFLRSEALDKAKLSDGLVAVLGTDESLSSFLRQNGYKNYYLPERILLFKESSGKHQKRKNKNARMLVICRETSFEQIKKCAVKKNPALEYVNLWDLDENRIMDAICRRNQMKAFTDIAFCYPEVRFEQMLLLMDTMVDKRITYHIYTTQSGKLIAPES